MKIIVEHEIGSGPFGTYAYYFPSQKIGPRWPMKIGYAKNPISRIRDQQAGMQECPIIGALIWSKHPIWVEQNIHNRLSDFRLDSFGTEWFNTNPNEILKLAQSPNYLLKSVIRRSGDIGYQIRHYRTQAGMSQNTLSRLSGLRQATISDLENGKVVQSDTVFRVIAALNLEMKMLPRSIG